MRILNIIVIIVSVLVSVSAYAGEKVAVLDFKSIIASEDLGIAVAEILRTELVGLGDYTVIERGMLEQIVEEQSLQLSGAIDSETAVEIGKLAGAKLVVTGSIVKTGSVYTINARFIDVETGVAKIGQNIRGQGEDEISNMVHQLALIITGKTTVTEEVITVTEAMEPTPTAVPTPIPTQPAEQPTLTPPAATPQPQPEQRPEQQPPVSQQAMMLFSFENQEELRQWKIEIPSGSSVKIAKKRATNGEHSLKIALKPHNDVQGMGTTYIPEDWSPYRAFAFDLYYDTKKPDAAWPLGVRVSDNRAISRMRNEGIVQGHSIMPGANTIRVYIDDLKQGLDIKQIKVVGIATNNLRHDVEAYIDNIRLETVLPPAPTEPFRASFESQAELWGKWQPNGRGLEIKLAQKHATHGSSSLHVDFPFKLVGIRFPGILSRAFPRDWSNYENFKADIYFDESGARQKESITLNIRIDDGSSKFPQGGFTWKEELNAGKNTIRFPLKQVREAIDITHIVAVSFFVEEPRQKLTLYLDNIVVQ